MARVVSVFRSTTMSQGVPGIYPRTATRHLSGVWPVRMAPVPLAGSVPRPESIVGLFQHIQRWTADVRARDGDRMTVLVNDEGRSSWAERR